MSAYVVVDIEVHDQDLMRQYRKLAYPALEAYGGRTVGRGKAEELDGTWDVSNIVVLEFPDMDKARAWFSSPEYAPALDLRRRASTARVILVSGA